MKRWLSLSLEKRGDLLARFAFQFKKSSYYKKSVRYYEQRVFRIKKGDYILDLPFSTLTKEALLTYARNELVLQKPRRVLLLLGGALPTPFIFILFQALLCGVYLSVKPSSQDPLFPFFLHEAFCQFFPSFKLWEVVSKRGAELIKEPLAAEAVLIFGSQAPLKLWAQKAKKEKKGFLGYGERISGACIASFERLSFQALAEDIFLYEQRGCFSPHFFLVLKEGKSFAQKLFQALKKEEKKFSPPSLTKQEKGQIFYTWQHYCGLKAFGKEIELLATKSARIIFLPLDCLPRFIGLRTVYVLSVQNWEEARTWLKNLKEPVSTLIVAPEEIKAQFRNQAFRVVEPGRAQKNSVQEPHENIFWVRALFGRKEKR